MTAPSPPQRERVVPSVTPALQREAHPQGSCRNVHYDWHQLTDIRGKKEADTMSESPSHSFLSSLNRLKTWQELRSGLLVPDQSLRGSESDSSPLRSDPRLPSSLLLRLLKFPTSVEPKTQTDLTWCCLTLCYTLLSWSHRATEKVLKPLFTTPTLKHTLTQRRVRESDSPPTPQLRELQKAQMIFRKKTEEAREAFWSSRKSFKRKYATTAMSLPLDWLARESVTSANLRRQKPRLETSGGRGKKNAVQPKHTHTGWPQTQRIGGGGGGAAAEDKLSHTQTPQSRLLPTAGTLGSALRVCVCLCVWAHFSKKRCGFVTCYNPTSKITNRQ